MTDNHISDKSEAGAMEMPEKCPHFFSGANFNFLKEIDYQSLVIMCQTAVKLEIPKNKFRYLVDAIRMYQFARIAAQQATDLENEMAKSQLDKSTLEVSMNPVLLAKSICDFVAYVKSTLDRVALFYNEYFNLGKKEQSCDFKWEQFRQDLLANAPQLKDYLCRHENWLSKNSTSTLSIFPLRDKWIHESYPIPTMALPIIIKEGLFPIPKDLLHVERVTPEDYMRLDYFLNFHGSALTELFNQTLILIRDLQLKATGEIEISNDDLFTPINITYAIYVREGLVINNMRADLSCLS